MYFGVEKMWGPSELQIPKKKLLETHFQAACPTQAGSILCAVEVWSTGCKSILAKLFPALRNTPLSTTKLGPTGGELIVCATAPFPC